MAFPTRPPLPISARRIVLSSAGPAETRQAYGIPASVRIFGPWQGKLKDDRERVTLKDKNDIMVCSVKYGSRSPWPVAAAGAGHALMLADHVAKGKDCTHPCCVEAAKEKKICEKCNSPKKKE